RCDGSLEHITCTVKMRWDMDVGSKKGVFRHVGVHLHEKPPAGIPLKTEVEEFNQRVANNPERKPLQHLVGRTLDPNDANAPISNISDSFLNRDRVAYLRKKVLIELDLWKSGSGGSLIHDLRQMEEEFGVQIASSSLQGANTHISIYTPFQQERVNDVDPLGVDGRTILGILTDMTYSFFADGYLISSVVYCHQVSRWVPVLYTFVEGQTTEHYEAHFLVLIKMVFDRISDQGQADETLKQVVDFSLAQKNAFCKAYAELRCDREKVNATLLKGCREHYRQSVTRVKRNHAIVPLDETKRFEELCGLLMSADCHSA
ncbi:hypothetical protein DFS34DRAFT_585361, partial [Phlyctochytrium arcticum]